MQRDNEIGGDANPYFLRLRRATWAALLPGKLLSAAVPMWLLPRMGLDDQQQASPVDGGQGTEYAAVEERGERFAMAIKLMIPSGPRLLTVEEWVQLPTADQYELIDGVLRKRMVNQNRHEFAVIRLAHVVSSHLDRRGVIASVFGSNTKYRVRGRRGIMPDLSVVLGAKVDGIDPDAAYNAIGPDLAVEVLSPEQDADYIEERLSDYWKLGTAEVWCVGPRMETITGYTREAHEFAVFAVARHDEEFSSRLLAGLSFSVKPLWMRRP